MLCTGNTDTVGSEAYNYKLGLARANAVKDFLAAEKGVNASRIKVDSKGETKPAKGEPPAKKDPDPGVKDPKNRRVEVRVEWPKGGNGKATGATAPKSGSQPKTETKTKPAAKHKGGSKPKGGKPNKRK